MILALLLIILASLLGIAALWPRRVVNDLVTLLSIGIIGGLAVVTTGIYILDIVLPIQAALIIGVLLTGTAAAWLGWQARHTSWRTFTYDRIAIGAFVAVLGLSMIVAPKLLIARPDGSLATGIINAYGDVAWHAANIVTFAEGQSVPPENPIFAGTRLTYPFMTNFFSALLMVGGLSLPASVNLPAVLLIPILVTLLYSFVRTYTGSKLAGVVALLLFLFGGATFGFIRLPADFQAAETSIVEFLTHLPARDYSGVGTDKLYHFLNPVTTLLLPQRSFLFGISMALAILILLVPQKEKPGSHYIVAGILSGVLPLFHGHTILALIPPIIGIWYLKPTVRSWMLFAIPALIIGLPEVFYYIGGQTENESFFRLGPGWMSGDHNIFWYWFQNTGLLVPAALASLFIPAINRPTKVVTGAGLIIFAVANVWLFAPWAWDNFKLFVFFLICALPGITALVQWGLQRVPRPAMTAVIVLVVATHMVSAAIDIFKLTLPTAAIWEEWSAEAVQAAQAIQANTKPGDVILTASNHNSAVVLAGRPRYLGFAAHVWSHGGNPWTREEAVKDYYKGELAELPGIRPQYVLVSPPEESSFKPIAAHDEWRFVTQVGSHFLYRITEDSAATR